MVTREERDAAIKAAKEAKKVQQQYHDQVRADLTQAVLAAMAPFKEDHEIDYLRESIEVVLKGLTQADNVEMRMGHLQVNRRISLYG